jgi:hypothetical protein
MPSNSDDLNKMKQEEVIKKYYYDPKTGLQSVDKLYRKLQKVDVNITRKMIKQIIDKQETAQIHKEIKTKEGSFIPRHSEHEIQIDLIYLEDSRLNKNNKYALTAINAFTKQLAVETLKKRDSSNVVTAMKKVFIKLDVTPKMIYSDLGSEFVSNEFKKLMTKLNIEHITTNTHAQLVERVHRTIKEMIAKYKTSTGSRTWENILDDIVDNYNNTYHNTIGIEPNNVNDDNKWQIQMNILKNSKPLIHREILQIGNQVRKKIIKKDLSKKGYKPIWSSEVYKITGKVKSRYTIDDNGPAIIRSQLQKIGEVEVNSNPPNIKGTIEEKLKTKNKPLPKHLSPIQSAELEYLNKIPILKTKRVITKKKILDL